MGSDDAAAGTKQQIPGGFINPEPDVLSSPSALVTYDEIVPYGQPLTARHRRVAELVAQGQLTEAEIGERTGYSADHIRALRRNSRICGEVEKCRDKIFEKTLGQQLTDASTDAFRVVVEMINDPNQKLRDRTDAAKWVLEMVGGKAKQQVSHEAGSSIVELLNKLDQFVASGGDSGRPVIEVTANAEEDDWMKQWVRENVPTLDNEKTVPLLAEPKAGEENE